MAFLKVSNYDKKFADFILAICCMRQVTENNPYYNVKQCLLFLLSHRYVKLHDSVANSKPYYLK